MSGRHAGDKAKATKSTGIVSRSESVTGKTLVQMQAERIAQTRFTEMMSAAGVSVDRMALEVMYWLPQDFMDLYQELYMRGLRNTDGGTAERGQAATETGELGKAPRKTAGGQGKKFKRYWTIADEQALALKEKIDKRLRSITRDIRDELTELDFYRVRGERPESAAELKKEGRRVLNSCAGCGIITSPTWNWCPKCGIELKLKVARIDRTNRNP